MKFKILIIFLMMFLILPTASSLEFDDVKWFDEDVGDYGKVTIKNWFGLLKIIELELKTNTDTCLMFCSAEKEIIIHKTGILIEDIKFETINHNGSRTEESIEDYLFSYRKLKGDWKPYALGTEVKEGTYEVRLDGKKSMFKTVDWVIKSNGFWIDDWAIWFTNPPLAYFSFDESSGDVLPNLVNSSNNGTITGMIDADWVGGILGNALRFNGTDDQLVNVSNNEQVSPPYVAISFWMNVSKFKDNIVIYRKGPIVGYTQYALYVNLDKTMTTIIDESGNLVSSELEINKWYYIVSAYNSSGHYLYINGELNNSNSVTSGDINISTSPLYINGAQAPGFFYSNVSIDEFGIWENLTETEILELYNSGVSLTYWGPKEIAVTLNSPVNNSNTSSGGAYFNVSYTSTANVELNNATYHILYPNGTLFNQTTKIITGHSNSTYLYISNFGVGQDYTWNVYACGESSTSTGCFWADSNYTFNVTGEWVEISQTYNEDTIEGSIETFNISIEYNNFKFSNIEARLNYNSTFYVGTKIGIGYNVSFTREIIIPSVGADTNITFYWEINLLNASSNKFNSTFNNQSVGNILIDDCTTYTTLILNASIFDEETQIMLTGADNATIEIDIDLFSVGATTSLIEFSQNYTNRTSAAVCIDDDLSNSTYQMDAQIFYDGYLYAPEYYHIQNLTLTNSTTTSIPQNIALLDLKDSSSQSFIITYKDENFLVVKDALIQVQRKYISEGLFKTVEIPKTNTNGEALAHLQLEEASYTMIITKEGVVLSTFNNMIAVCQNPSLETCEINLNAFASATTTKDFTVGDDFVFTLTYDKDAREIESVFSIPSGGVSEVILNTTLYDGIGSTPACSDSLTSASGTLSCVVPLSLGNGTVITKITKDGDLMGQAFISLEQEPEDLYGGSLVFLGLFLILTLIGLGIGDNPMITGFFFIIGAILLIALNLVDTGVSSFVGAGATILWLIVAIIIVMIKGAKRT